MPCPLYDETLYGTLLSSSHFYDIKHIRKEQPSNTCTLRMPIPQDYSGKTLCVLGSDLHSNYYLENDESDDSDNAMLDRWTICDTIADVPGNTLACDLKHFSM